MKTGLGVTSLRPIAAIGSKSDFELELGETFPLVIYIGGSSMVFKNEGCPDSETYVNSF